MRHWDVATYKKRANEIRISLVMFLKVLSAHNPN